ncbi:MAG: 30S ribosomal protein S8e, partial [Candidatus Nanohaloarchaea archaeon]
MVKRQTRSTRKVSGGRRRRLRKPRKSDGGGDFAATTIGDPDVRQRDSRGKTDKRQVKRVETVTLSVDGETTETDVENVVENPANPDYVRRDIMTKGAIIETEEGRARVTSRPGQDGTVNAVLVE